MWATIDAPCLVEPFELGIERVEHLADDALDHAQGMLRRHPLLQVHLRKQ
jgi:hypothetical protein